MVSRNVAINSTLEVSGAKGRSDLAAIQSLRHFNIIDGSILCVKFEPNGWISILRSILFLYRGSFNVSVGLDEASCADQWSRPYFVVPLLDCIGS